VVLPDEVAQWTLTTLREKLIKIGARIVRHGRYMVFQLAEVAVTRALFAEILRRIERCRKRPRPGHLVVFSGRNLLDPPSTTLRRLRSAPDGRTLNQGRAASGDAG
jgi:hypothetical protein